MMLVVFVANLCTQKGKVHQPNVIKKIMDQIFAILKSNGFQYGMVDMALLSGLFQAVCVDQFCRQADTCPGLGHHPNKALIVMNDEEMFQTMATLPFHPFMNPMDHLLFDCYIDQFLILCLCCCVFCCRRATRSRQHTECLW